MVATPMLLPAPERVQPAGTLSLNATCTHESRRYLGTDRTTDFYRCGGCGAVLILQRECLWVLRAAQTP